jgi:hypothetical protein
MTWALPRSTCAPSGGCIAVVKCGAWQGDSKRCDRHGRVSAARTKLKVQNDITESLVRRFPRYKLQSLIEDSETR